MNDQDIFEVRQTDVEIQEALDQVPKNKKAIEGINAKLPEGASSENPLTDKTYVDGKVSAEAQDRDLAYQTLDGKIDANTHAIATETERAEGAESTLDGKIAAEAQAREQADQTLDGKIAANTQSIANEKSRAEGAEGVLDGKITAEAQARTQADQTLDGKIAANTQAIANEKARAEGAEQALQTAIDTINGKIPAQATAQNQLADKNFVNSSISTATADFKGTYNSLQELELVTANANDYAFVIATDAAGNTVYKRYKWVDGTGWTWEYDLNNSSFTAAQWAAIQSGITAALVTKLTDLPTNAELNQRISTAITTAVANYYTKTEIDAALAAINTAIGQEVTRAQGAEQTLTEELNTLSQGLDNGDVVPALATNLESWEGEEGESDYVQTAVADTTGGTLSIDSSKPANLLSVVPTSDFGATALVATGFNLLRFATAVGTGWYILVPKLTATAASIGTAQENNGVLFTDAQGHNLRPTVRFKALADGVPTSVTDGVVATYVDADGRRHYTTSGIGYLIVSDINRATTCMHLGWSRRYDEYVAVNAAGDAGATVNLAAGINALHDFGLMLQIGALADSIERTSATQATWHRRVQRVQPTWTNTPVEEEGVATGQYLHETIISNMRPDGAAAFMGSDQALTVAGTSVSYTDGNAEALTNYVKFELAAVASGTASVSSSFAVEDWGLILIQGATGTAAFTIAYAQGIPDNLRTALPQLNAIRTSAAAISLGHGICSTDTYTKDKVVTIPNFLLLQNGHVDVLFTTPINTELSTLNVSLTGAKPIRILGQSLPAGVIKAQTYATLVYDGTAWNIVNLFCPGAEYDPAGLLVDMGLPSGVKWAARDIDLTKPGGFCETPFIYEKSFFSWGNIDGHNPTSVSSFSPYNWGGVNQAEPWYDGQPYGSTPGNTLTGNIAVGEDFDAARANLGAPWRMPTSAEFAELFANIRYINADGTEVDTTKADKRVNVNGILGLYLESKINGARLFLSCSGYGDGRSWYGRGSNGYYWSSTFYSARSARNLYFFSGGVYPQSSNYYRYNGFAVRPVQ